MKEREPRKIYNLLARASGQHASIKMEIKSGTYSYLDSEKNFKRWYMAGPNGGNRRLTLIKEYFGKRPIKEKRRRIRDLKIRISKLESALCEMNANIVLRDFPSPTRGIRFYQERYYRSYNYVRCCLYGMLAGEVLEESKKHKVKNYTYKGGQTK